MDKYVYGTRAHVNSSALKKQKNLLFPWRGHPCIENFVHLTTIRWITRAKIKVQIYVCGNMLKTTPYPHSNLRQ